MLNLEPETKNDFYIDTNRKKIWQVELDIVEKIKEICDKNNINYSLNGGTLLGAVRHKGFIPWDDDMDFGVPYEYYSKLERVLAQQLRHPYKSYCYKNHIAAFDNFIKIVDTSTRLDDKKYNIPLNEQLGLNIDIFPLVRCKKRDKRIYKIKFYKTLIGSFYISQSHPDSRMRKAAKLLLQIMAGGSTKPSQNKIEKLLAKKSNGNYLANFLGHWQEKEIIPIEWYGDNTRFEFEDTSFIGIRNYDAYLKQLYGDYMQLPPVEKRIAHIDNVYLMEDEVIV